MMKTQTITNFDFLNFNLLKQGKVRSVYDLHDYLLFVSSDRVSAFDVIMSQGIPEKGAMLTQLSEFWFRLTSDIIPNHFITSNVDDYPEVCHPHLDVLNGRSMLVKKATVLPVECVVRGYIIGSGWKDYQQTGAVCGITLPEGLQLAQKLDEPIFTPAFKAELGDHDENITYQKMVDLVGSENAAFMKQKSFELYQYGLDYAQNRGIILADTKFEFGMVDDQIVLIDEVLTPDSSRYWPSDSYAVGSSPPSFDKQILRDYLAPLDWNREAPAPPLPDAIIDRIAARYREVYTKLRD